MPKRRNTNQLTRSFKRLKMAQGSEARPAVVGGGAAATHGGHQETQQDPIASGWQLQPGPPDYTHCVLPFIYERQYQAQTFSDFSAMDFGIRMTSPYDPILDPGSTVDLNAGAGTQNHRPILTDSETRTDKGMTAYWDFYASTYKYYSVLGCRYRIRVENLSHEKFYVHQMFINNDRPNPNASNWDMLLWRGVKSRLVTPIMRFGDTTKVWNTESNDYAVEDDDMNAAGTTNASGTVTGFARNPIGSPMAVFAGEYRPGDYKREIKLDDDVEIWTPVSGNPTLPETLFLRVRAYDNATPPFGGDADNYQRRLTFNITVECEYLVEFKELQDIFYRPASRNPIVTLGNPVAQDGLL